jgi:hypothetical protein
LVATHFSHPDNSNIHPVKSIPAIILKGLIILLLVNQTAQTLPSQVSDLLHDDIIGFPRWFEPFDETHVEAVVLRNGEFDFGKDAKSKEQIVSTQLYIPSLPTIRKGGVRTSPTSQLTKLDLHRSSSQGIIAIRLASALCFYIWITTRGVEMK